MKQVRDSARAKKISVWVILKEGKEIATIQALYNSVVRVDVWSKYELIHQGKAGGYGYDKITAALYGTVIDGIRIFDHCGQDERSKELREQVKDLDYNDAQTIVGKEGYIIANWGTSKDVYAESGLRRLETLGYTVIQAL